MRTSFFSSLLAIGLHCLPLLQSVVASPIQAREEHEAVELRRRQSTLNQQTVQWLDNWITTHMSNYSFDTTPFQVAYIDSIKPFFPTLRQDSQIDFTCSIRDICNAGLVPVSGDSDTQYAWEVLRGLQNVNSFYRFQWLTITEASDHFTSNFADQIWNLLKGDGGSPQYAAKLPTAEDGIKQILRMTSNAYADVYKTTKLVAGLTMDAIASLYIPGFDLIMDIVKLTSPATVIPASIPNADLKAEFGNYVDGQARVVETAFRSIVNGAPRDPTTGFLTLLQKNPDAWLGNQPTWATDSVSDYRDNYVNLLRIAFINVYYSTTGQIFALINDSDWNDPSDCDGSASSGMNYPVCLDDPTYGGFNLAWAPKTRFNDAESDYGNIEGPQFVYLNNGLFNHAGWNISAFAAVKGSIKCQQSRTAAGTFDANAWLGGNHRVMEDGDFYMTDLSAQGRADAAAGNFLLYTPSMDPDDACQWSVPVMYGLYDIGGPWQSGGNQLKAIINSAYSYMRGFLNG